MKAPLLSGPGLCTRRVRVPRAEVAWVRYVIEAHDGLANLHGSGDGTITLVTPDARVAELERVLDDLAQELDLERVEASPDGEDTGTRSRSIDGL